MRSRTNLWVQIAAVVLFLGSRSTAMGIVVFVGGVFLGGFVILLYPPIEIALKARRRERLDRVTALMFQGMAVMLVIAGLLAANPVGFRGGSMASPLFRLSGGDEFYADSRWNIASRVGWICLLGYAILCVATMVRLRGTARTNDRVAGPPGARRRLLRAAMIGSWLLVAAFSQLLATGTGSVGEWLGMWNVVIGLALIAVAVVLTLYLNSIARREARDLAARKDPESEL